MAAELAVQHAEVGLRIGEFTVHPLRAAFDDPYLLTLLTSGGMSGSARILKFLFSPDDYLRIREHLRSAPGLLRDNIGQLLQEVLKDACPELMTFLWMAGAHPNELAFDFQRFLSIDLDKAWRKMSPRKLAGFAVAMPAEGSLHRAINPDWQWGTEAQLLAGVYDSLSYLRWEAAKLAGAKPGKAPDQLERPGVTPKSKADVVGAGEGLESIEDFEAWYAEKKSHMKPAPE